MTPSARGPKLAAVSPIWCVAGPAPNVGKTTVALALLAGLIRRGFRPAAIKPLALGCRYGKDHDLVCPDSERFRALLPHLPPLVVSPYRFTDSVAPDQAIARAGLDLSLTELTDATQTALAYGVPLIVELPGALDAPLTADETGLDLIDRLSANLLLVAGDHDPRPTLSAAEQRGISVLALFSSNDRPDPRSYRQSPDPEALDRTLEQQGFWQILQPQS